MSVELEADSDDRGLPETDLETRYGPQPISHGGGVMAVFADQRDELDVVDDDSIYQAVRSLWYDVVGDREHEPGIVLEPDSADYEWLPAPRQDREWVLILESSRWKAGTGEGDDYTAWYKYDLTLRERDDDGEFHKPPWALSLRVEPQQRNLVYRDGNPLKLPYGEGTLVKIQSTWAETGQELERRMIDVLSDVVDADAQELLESRVDESRRVQKCEAHVRASIDEKPQLVETVEQSKQLIAYGGGSEIDAHQTRMREGYLEAVLESDRWDLLGFGDLDYRVELKLYQAAGWHKISRSEPGHHPKLEASLAGVDDGKLPHVDEWDQVLGKLRGIVSSHLEWADVDRGDLVADHYFDGPAAPEYTYSHPVGRREQLRERYESVSTEIYREATKANTKAVYDILRVVAESDGATYDQLEERVGLARSSIRRHVRRLQEAGVVDRVGNPVIVVFPSLEVLDRASEILRTIYPGETFDDMNERAQERRERREERDERAPDVDETDADSTASSDDGSGSSSSWAYLRDVELDGPRLATAIEKEYLGDRDVRIRVSEIPWATG